MEFGLKKDTTESIQHAIEKVAAIDRVMLYGSRAKGNYRVGSDIDITLLGKNLTLDNSIYPLMDELEKLDLPYTFDISIFEHIDNQNLIAHIHRVGKVLYARVPSTSLKEDPMKQRIPKKDTKNSPL